ncbi:MAG: hypothetical protein R3253_03165 [Longimicrobiales bacterium]|nr:hypothetical protein [Longimicrobiales bacterium]
MSLPRRFRADAPPVGLLPIALAVVAVMSLGAAADHVRAQTPAEVAASCVGSGGAVDPCLAGATAAHSLMGSMSLAGGAGSAIPGTASNLGTRVGGGPRLSFHARAMASKWAVPAADDLAGERDPTVTSIRLGAAAGVFDGFRLMPTVGGFLATDLFGDVTLSSPGQGDGFSGGVRSYALGARIGLFREGFTIPGASVSVARRFSGSLDYGDVPGGDVLAATVDPATTSIRAAVSKDLFAVELLAGVGWDDVSGDVTVRVPDGAGGTVVSESSMDGSRHLYFASASMTFSLILTLTAEGGWAAGLPAVPGYDGPHDPTSGRVFGGFSARLVF